MIPAWYLHFLDVVVFWIAFWQTVFVVAYAPTPWWSWHIGRALMFKGAGLAAIFDLAVLTRLLGDDYPGRFYVSATCFAVVALGSAYQAIVIVAVRWQHRDDPAASDPYVREA